MTDVEAENLYDMIGAIVQNQNEARETMKKLVISIEFKRMKDTGKGVTINDWDDKKAEILHRVGLGPKPRHMLIQERRKSMQERVREICDPAYTPGKNNA